MSLRVNAKILLWVVSLFLVTATLPSCKSLQNGTKREHYTTRGKKLGHKPRKPDFTTPAKGEWATLDVELTSNDNPALYEELKTWLGTPYKYAANEKGVGTDCSGMVQQVYLKVYNIPLERRSSKMMEKNCEPIDSAELAEGDLVFFDTSRSGGITHVGIYLKDKHFVHTSSSRGVMVSNLLHKYWMDHYHCSGRVKKK